MTVYTFQFDRKLGKIVALLSFVFGTLFFVTYLISKIEIIALIGFYYLLIAFFVNICVLIKCICSLISLPKLYEEHIQNMGILLLNIPVVIVYITILIKTF